MGDVVSMDSLSRGVKLEGNGAENPGQNASRSIGENPNGSLSDMPEKHQKALQKTLGQLQKAAPVINKMASRGILGQLGLIKSVFDQIDLTRDWIFIPFVAFFALLKDIFDLSFAGGVNIPVIGVAVGGVGVVVSFIMAVMLLMLTVVALLLTGSDLKNRGQAKGLLTLLMSLGFIAEILPGLDWMPLAFIETLLVYGLVLFDRMELSSDQKNDE